MNKFVRKYPFGSHLLTVLVCMLVLMFVLIYCKTKYFEVSIDTYKRMETIYKTIVPDSLNYFASDTLKNE